MFREFLAGAGSYWHAWNLVWRAHMWPVLLLPGLVAAIYFPLALISAWFLGNIAATYINDHWTPEFLKARIFVILMTIALLALGGYLAIIFFRNVVMILFSPFLTYLSRKTEQKSRPGGTLPADDAGIIQGAIRGIIMSLTSLGLAILCFCACVVLLLIPFIGHLAFTILLTASQMFLAGQGFLDPALERYGFGVRKSLRFAGRNGWRTLGCGAIFTLLTMIPIIGWFLAPTLGVIAGTLLTLETFEKSQPYVAAEQR